MPLPQFLWLMAAVIVAAAATLWVSLSHGVPIVALALAALIAAGVVHYTRHDNQPH
jgi:Flp pilus assembly protein TadB